MTRKYIIDNNLYEVSFNELYSLIKNKNPKLVGYQISDEFSYNPINYLNLFGIKLCNENYDFIKTKIDKIINDFKEYTNILFILGETRHRIHNITQKYTGEVVSQMLVERITQEILDSIKEVEDEYGIYLKKFEPVPKIKESDGILLISFSYKEKFNYD